MIKFIGNIVQIVLDMVNSPPSGLTPKARVG